MKLKFSAIQILLAELQPIEMGAIYLMGAGSEEIPDTVTKRILMNIITFLCEKLDWIRRPGSTAQAMAESLLDAGGTRPRRGTHPIHASTALALGLRIVQPRA